MFKIGIIGADSPQAGEIIRILLHHPEIEIANLYAPSKVGRNASTTHHGLIGEVSLNFTDKINLEDIDLFFITERSEVSDRILLNIDNYENLKIISLSDSFVPSDVINQFETGLSEINRKALVRGAREAIIPSFVSIPSLIALVPLAYFMLLNSDIEIVVSIPEEFPDINIEAQEEFLQKALMHNEASFDNKINLKISRNSTLRASTSTILMRSNLPIEEIEKVYDQIYDDHNFSFFTLNDVNTAEVEGTQKVVININKPSPDTLKLKVVADSRLRGGAGDAVQVMNLFFALHEKTGLHLKPSCYNVSK